MTVENPNNVWRMEFLRKVPAKVRFVSMEPLLGPLPGLNLDGIDWAIVGGESGPGARTMKEEWVVNIKRQCRKNGVAFFFKQWGSVNKKKAGRLLKGQVYSEMPATASSST